LLRDEKFANHFAGGDRVEIIAIGTPANVYRVQTPLFQSVLEVGCHDEGVLVLLYRASNLCVEDAHADDLVFTMVEPPSLRNVFLSTRKEGAVVEFEHVTHMLLVRVS